MTEALRPAMGRADWFRTCPLVGWSGEPTEEMWERGWCHWCGGPLSGRQRCWCSPECSDAIWEQHMWTLARAAALRRDNYTCVECGTTAAVLEVDHIEPCWGKHAQNGCHHHLDNLQTLCHDCHVAKTNKAARDRAREARLNQGVMSLID